MYTYSYMFSYCSCTSSSKNCAYRYRDSNLKLSLSSEVMSCSALFICALRSLALSYSFHYIYSVNLIPSIKQKNCKLNYLIVNYLYTELIKIPKCKGVALCLKSRVRIVLLFLCIVYFVYFTNYFRVCISVYLLTINFVRVLIVYFQNIVYSCITINFTVSYVKIAHIYYIPCTCYYSI